METKSKKDSQSNQSSDKLLNLLDFMSALDSPIRLSELAKAVNMNISTLSRFLMTLIRNGYVAQEQENGRYYMTYKICQISNNVITRRSLRAASVPLLKKISAEFKCAANLIELYDNACVYLESVVASNTFVAPLQRIGKVAPLYCTGAGKLLLQSFTEEMLDEYASQTSFEIFTEYTISNGADLKKAVREAREKGYAIDAEECEYGIRCLALPVYDYTNKVVAALSISMRAGALTDEFVEHNLKKLKAYARKFSLEMGAKM